MIWRKEAKMTPEQQTVYFKPTQSRRYERYVDRIRMLGKAFVFIRKHRIAICTAMAVVTGAILCLLAISGFFMGEARCGDYVYGELPQCGLQAFLSEYTYQYASGQDGNVWTDGLPAMPGQYRLRAVTKNPLGIVRHSDEMNVTMHPRQLQVSIPDVQYVYGDFSDELLERSTHTQGLLPGHKLADVRYRTEGAKNQGYQVSIETLSIVDKNGADVTAGYELHTQGGMFTMIPRAITVEPSDIEKEYDAVTSAAVPFTLSQGTLAEGDQLLAEYDKMPVDVGGYTLRPTCRVLDSQGEDVSDCYTIRVEKGALVILPRRIELWTGSGEKQFDDTELKNPQWGISSGELVQGHSLTVMVHGSQRFAGESQNKAVLMVQDASGMNVTSNYQFQTDWGILKVTPIVLCFQTDSAEMVYDGTFLTAAGFDWISGSVLSGHKLHAETRGMINGAGTKENDLLVTVRNAKGEDVTLGYHIQVDVGMLTVHKRPLTIISGSAEKLYDSTPLTWHHILEIKGTMAPGGGGERIGYSSFTGSQTEVGSSPNRFTVRIRDDGGNDKTDNYDITYEYGTLTVLENPDFSGDDGAGDQPGTGDGSGDGGGSDGSGSGGDGDGSDGSGSSGGDGDGSGGSGSSGGEGGSGGTPGSSANRRGQGTTIGYPDASGGDTYYAKVKSLGNDHAPMWLLFRELSYGYYNGSGWDAPKLYRTNGQTPLGYIGKLFTNSKEAVWLEYEIPEDCSRLTAYFAHPVNGTNDCYFTDPGGVITGEFVQTGYSYSDLQGMQVSPEDQKAELAYRKFVYENYRALPLTTKNTLLAWAQQRGITADSSTLIEDIQRAVQNAAKYDRNGQDYPAGVDVAVYFLTEAKTGICQHFATAGTLLYRAFGIPARYTVGFADTVYSGKTTVLNNENAHAWVEVYIDGLGWVPVDVTPAGDGVIAPKPELFIQVCGATKYYDGKTFENYDLNSYMLSGDLQKGHRVEVVLKAGPQSAAPGEYYNQIQRCMVYDASGRNVTNQYQIYGLKGKLQILPRKITVVTGSASKRYDGTAVTSDRYWITQGSLLSDDRLILETVGSQTAIGSSENTVGSYSILCGSNGMDVTGYYDITFVYGTLQILSNR